MGFAIAGLPARRSDFTKAGVRGEIMQSFAISSTSFTLLGSHPFDR
ncbi:MAG: hypothetical protein ACKVRP_09595 [Bacteroidota bacterium]